jgi:hypothetical protein
MTGAGRPYIDPALRAATVVASMLPPHDQVVSERALDGSFDRF